MSRDLFIFSSGTIKRKENTIYLETNNGERKFFPVENIDSIHLFGEIELNTKALNFFAQKNIVIHIYNYYGYYSGSYLPREKNVSGELLVRQVQHYLDEEERMYLAYSFVEGALFHMQRNLREYENTNEFVIKISQELENAKNCKSIQELMGCEGRARDVYYNAFNLILKSKFFFEKREKRPPTNPINALISFGNSLIYSTVLSEIYKTQLNPTISYLHEPRERRFSLSLDLSEIFKPLIVDPIIFKLINNNMLKDEDFDQDVNYCYLTESGRKKFLKEFDSKMETTIKHRKLGRSVSYKFLIRLECYKLIKHLLKDEIYKPLKAWW
ncbi:type I-B CRISPR-associated endonuclease Cas1b [Dictyoglomus thermophilum]|uniref:CRISPR-associated endonuclease Cas1 n=1 Tax=Dictyoglomus thermophilum (strain ATCC 35947 / DSM 3960 / H-6-12) TaxID=309799 RepID=B5YAX6_DICT6|nr:type I-B CRISPR-associated endonuclease Cas1b [Dictyoglomus thermophilum]ACI18526.1 CRISPR-associated protein Cas1, HMARI/TNEAP subtype [Dictyoglomus thermophilum H-6-12]